MSEWNIQCHNYLPVVKKFTSYLEIRATSPFTSHYSSSCRHGEWLHLCSIALSAEPSRTSAFTAMTAIRHAGGFVSFDPNI
ncbi:hypothetical protein, partial [Escherichia coli]|uniref:hypothetical protein n=1 Tax=Escherichia coli TaxID=562 RepID=UPI003EE35240